jgi:hypothetical protein
MGIELWGCTTSGNDILWRTKYRGSSQLLQAFPFDDICLSQWEAHLVNGYASD